MLEARPTLLNAGDGHKEGLADRKRITGIPEGIPTKARHWTCDGNQQGAMLTSCSVSGLLNPAHVLREAPSLQHVVVRHKGGSGKLLTVGQ